MRLIGLLCTLFCPMVVSAQSLSLDLLSRDGTMIKVALTMHDIPDGQAGYQAFVHFDTSKLQFCGGYYVLDAFAVPLFDPIVAPNGDISLAAGIDFMAGQPPAGGTAVLAVLTFQRLISAKPATTISFAPHAPPTEFADEDGNVLIPATHDLCLP